MSINPPKISEEQQDFEQTEHPHIIRVQGIGNGEPIIKNTRISVRLIAEYYKAGLTVEEVLRDYPHLNAAAIYDAISYYIDHQDEIEALLEANRIETVLADSGLTIREDGLVYRVDTPPGEA
jgi:uncharacterized protein (DUF433 family)